MSKELRNIFITILLVTLTIICCYLCACNNDQENCKHEWGDWKPLQDGHYHVCKLCHYKSKTYTHSFDDYVLTENGYEHKCNLCSYIDKVPTEIVVKNVEYNNRLYKELNNKLDKFGKKLEQSNNLSYLMQIAYNNNEVSMSVKAMQSPIYLEVSSSIDEKEQNPSVVREEDGKIFSYVNKEDNYYKKIYLGDKEKYEQPSDDMPDFSFVYQVNIKTDACNFTYKNDVYTIQAYYKDLIDDNLQSQLEEILGQLNVDANKLYNAITTIKITVKNNLVRFSVEIAINVGNYVNPDIIHLQTVQTADLSEFAQVNFTNGKYKILNATSIDEVYELTDISKPIQCDDSLNVFKVDFSQGQYVIKSDYFVQVNIVPVDDIENEIPLSIGDGISSYLDYDYYNSFSISKSGQYYVTFINGQNDTYDIIRCDYNDVFDLNNPKSLQETMTGIVEGKYDLDYYAYSSDKDRLLTLTNTSDLNIEIICKEYKENFFMQKELCPHESLLIYMGKEQGKFFVCQPNTENPIKYSLTATFYDNDNGSSEIYEDMPIITDTFSKDYYMTGYGFADKYMRLIVETKGQYLFEFEGMWNDYRYDSLQTTVYDKNMNRIDSYYNEFDVGEYIVELTNNDHILGIAKIKYVFKSTADYEKNVVLPTLSYEKRLYTSNYLLCENVTDKQVIKYRFTLQTNQNIMYDVEHITIYDENDEMISPLYYNSFYNNFEVLNLDSGNYYFMSRNRVTSPNYNTYLCIAITPDFAGDTVLDYGNMKVLDNNHSISLKKDYMYDKDYFAIHVSEAGKYQFKTLSLYIFDSKLNIVEPQYDQNCRYFELDIGIYYVILEHKYDTDIGNYITVKLDKYAD